MNVRIGVFCSGGDAPGMNSCVRAVVRAGVTAGHEIVGIQRGYQGLLDEDFFVNCEDQPHMKLRSVSDWGRHGGTFLRSSRSDEFRTEAGLRKASGILEQQKIAALIPIGGDGTFNGAVALAKHWNGQIVGCPGTIDNDLMGTDFTIGFSTAVRTAVSAVDKIRDTAESHERMFLIEVMGRHSGFIAVYTAIAGQAECVCIPETNNNVEKIVADIERLKKRGKSSIMMIVAEGDEDGGAELLAQKLAAANCPFSTRAVILGHLQRGGSPTPEDRILGSQLGRWAVAALDNGATGGMIGNIGDQEVFTPFEETFATHKPIPNHLLEIIDTLAH
jgi:6-phosphofructokinase 1